MSITPGTKFGHYEIRSKLGEGGMGEVYLAVDTELDRTVAIKILPQALASDPARLQRFVQEAKAASALNHPHILTIHEIGTTGTSRFIATEFIDGDTLRQRMRRESLGVNEILEIAAQVAGALAAAHAAGIIHRDIKPENVMVRRDGYLKLLDFGLAKVAATKSVTTDPEALTKALVNTDAGTVMGTANYMSPEQARGLKVDTRTDIFSLGVLIYEMVAGRLPFEGSTSSEVLASILSNKEPPPLARYAREVPAELERIVSKALRKNRDDRYQTIKDLLIDLKDLSRKLELEAQLERSNQTPLNLQAATQTDHKLAIADGTQTGAAQTGMQVSGATSSVEYLVSQMKSHRRSVLLALGLVVIGAIAISYFLFFKRGPTLLANHPEIKSIAVLPLANLSGDPAQDYFADGMTEELIGSLGKIGNLRVTSRVSAMQYKNAPKALKEIARELGVDAVVEGSVLRSGDRVRITVRLIHGATEQGLWGDNYERDLRDILALQSEVGRAIANEIRITLTSKEQGLLASARPVDPKALEAYLKGRDYFNQGRNQVGTKYAELLKLSIGYFEQAVSIDPNYALAYSGLSRASHWLASGGPPEYWPKSKDAATRALQIDETLAEAHAALGFILHRHDWDFAGAEREYKRALELNPSHSDAHGGYSLLLSALGRHEEAIGEGTLGLALDPLTIPLKTNFGALFIDARQYDRAIEYLRPLRDSDPSSGVRLPLGIAYVHRGMFDQGIVEIREGAGINAPHSLFLAWAYATAGRRDEAIKILDESLKRLSGGAPVSKVRLARVYAALGDRDQAFAWLEKAYAEHSDALGSIKSGPTFDTLRSDPRFVDLTRRIGLPQ
jgi:serine/threonine-protein kinase